VDHRGSAAEGRGAGGSFGAPPDGEGSVFSSHHQHSQRLPRSQQQQRQHQYPGDSHGAEGGAGGGGEYDYSSAPPYDGDERNRTGLGIGGSNGDGGGDGASALHVAHPSRQDGADGVGAAASASASSGFPRHYDYVEYSTPMEFQGGGEVPSSLREDRGGGGAHRQAVAPPRQQQQQQRDLRSSSLGLVPTSSTGLLPQDIMRSQPSTTHASRGVGGGGGWDGAGSGGGGGGGGVVQSVAAAAAERGGGRGATGGGAGGAGELDYSDGYTAHGSTSSGHHITRQNAVSETAEGGGACLFHESAPRSRLFFGGEAPRVVPSYPYRRT